MDEPPRAIASRELLHRREQAGELVAVNAGGAAAGANSCAEQGLIRINVSHSAQQLLVEQRALDRSLTAAKQFEEAIGIGFQRLDATGFEAAGVGDAEPSEAPGVDKAQFLA